MRRTRKIAFVGHEWFRIYARDLAGGLSYAATHPSTNIVIQPFSKNVPVRRLATKIERWGADGVYGMLSDKEITGLKGALRHPIPIVTNFGSDTNHPGVVQVVGDAHTWVETAVGHLQHLGVKSFGLLWSEPPPETDNRWLPSFQKFTRQRGSVLMQPISEHQLLAPDRNARSIPAALARWLRGLPKPCGVLCPSLGAGKFLVKCCVHLGLQVPDKIAIIGADEADVSLSCTPTATSVLQNLEMLGAESVRILLDLLEGVAPPAPKNRIQACDLVIRESTGQQRPIICDIAGALEYIKASATKGLSVTQLLHATQRCSQPIFYQSFQKATGKTPAQAIRDRQLEEVRRLLATTQFPVEIVADLAGFSSSTVMGRLFLKTEGISPLEYRKRQNNGKRRTNGSRQHNGSRQNIRSNRRRRSR
jgi:LacI family transcriptional regulator